LPEINPANHMPNILITDFLKDVEQFFNIGFLFNHKERSVRIEHNDSIIKNSFSQDLTHKLISNSITRNIQEKPSAFSLTMNFDPDDEFASQEISSIDLINYKGEVNSYIDLPNSPRVGDIHLVLDENLYYQYQYTDPGDEWVKLSMANVYHSSGSNVKRLTKETDASPLLMDIVEDTIDVQDQWGNPFEIAYEWLVPRADMDGSLYPDFKTRFMIYQGIQQGQVTGTVPPGGSVTGSTYYPLGSNDVYDYFNNKISNANLALRWTGQYGLLENFWQHLIQWEMNSKEIVELFLDLAAKDLLSIDFSSKYRIQGIDYFFDEIIAPFSNKQIKSSQVKALRA
jgi:hypothetical protein